ncbi:FeoA domain-containing protein [Desulfobulbus rhabdoformis]|uniref:metal-dependent transcriptional regulator n=1 Tax=Desulfobulbus rhabdoformis TaxID=34032 RepID=UPI00196507A7|nr:iron dependent repressor, metal binding and dimerization domain protein [Desulfobulbus rhabdoformis]MBM9614126.1 FeoA domain-containing protein [Desulfobulbus rhabdoformis]
MSEQIQIQHALKFLAECEYERQEVTPESIAAKLTLSPAEGAALLHNLQVAELIEPERIRLTESGRDYALHVLKAHRLYETYLAKKTGHHASQWHKLADEREHELSRQDVEKLDEELGYPRFDPHGDPIPSSTGEMPNKRGALLSTYPVGWVGRVIHIEDEPAHLYSRISQASISTDSIIRLEKKDSLEIVLYLEGERFSFPLEVAEKITVVELDAGEQLDETVQRLSRLPIGAQAQIVGMSSLCRGLERNRLLDLGVVPGTITVAELMNPSGSPVGYRIRGACIALRKEQADRIRIRNVEQ